MAHTKPCRQRNVTEQTQAGDTDRSSKTLRLQAVIPSSHAGLRMLDLNPC
jgi:hypothetical protein